MIRIGHVLCPIDFSPFSARALRHAAAWSRWYGAQLTVLHVWHDVPAMLDDVAAICDDGGVHGLSVMDHWFGVEAMGLPADDPMLEGYTTLAYLAARTRRAKLRLLVSGVTYRHPGLLAKTVTTLDVLSGGRAQLGIGAAWYEREAQGVEFAFPQMK